MVIEFKSIEDVFSTSLWWIILSMWTVYLFNTYLSYRQMRVYKKTIERPADVKLIMDNGTFTKSRLYAIDKRHFSMIHDTYKICEGTVFLALGALPYLWSVSQRRCGDMGEFLMSKTGRAFGLTASSEIACSITFVLFASLVSTILEMPWNLYSTFVVEERHGFNKQTIGFFLKDILKHFMLAFVLEVIAVTGLVYIVHLGGSHFYLFAYAFVSLLTLVLMFVYPEFIAPLFDNFAPLPESDLRKKIFALAEKTAFPLKKLFVVEGSKRSSHSNAYFFGLGSNKRIVLFDTLIKGFVFPGKEADGSEQNRGCDKDEQILAILAHELGHWKCSHILYFLTLHQLSLLAMFLIFGSYVDHDHLYVDFGFAPLTCPTILKMMILFAYILLPFNTVMGFVSTFITRKFEFQADRFSVGLGYATHLKSSLQVLQTDNLSFPVNDPLYSAFTFSHPPILERCAAIDIEDRRLKNKSD